VPHTRRGLSSNAQTLLYVQFNDPDFMKAKLIIRPPQLTVLVEMSFKTAEATSRVIFRACPAYKSACSWKVSLMACSGPSVSARAKTSSCKERMSTHLSYGFLEKRCRYLAAVILRLLITAVFTVTKLWFPRT